MLPLCRCHFSPEHVCTLFASPLESSFQPVGPFSFFSPSRSYKPNYTLITAFKTRVMPRGGALALLSPTLTCMCLFPDRYSSGFYLEIEQGWGQGSGLWWMPPYARHRAQHLAWVVTALLGGRRCPKRSDPCSGHCGVGGGGK